MPGPMLPFFHTGEEALQGRKIDDDDQLAFLSHIFQVSRIFLDYNEPYHGRVQTILAMRLYNYLKNFVCPASRPLYKVSGNCYRRVFDRLIFISKIGFSPCSEMIQDIH